jgi:predicted nucleic acid binding AN1-type Zn finger protein
MSGKVCAFAECNKKIKLVDEITCMCRCGLYFCRLHKFPIDHNCTFDIQKKFREQLEKKLTKLTGNKLNKI